MKNSTVSERIRRMHLIIFVKEAMEYKLEHNFNPLDLQYTDYNRLMYCTGTRLTTNLRATSKEVTWRVIYIIYSTLTGPVSRGF